MRMLKNAPKEAEDISAAAHQSLVQERNQLRSQLAEARQQIRTEHRKAVLAERDQRQAEALLAAVTDGRKSDAISWAILKVVAQRRALNQLTARNTRLRFQLREITRLGRGLTRQEFLAARKRELEDRPEADAEMMKKRIGKPSDED